MERKIISTNRKAKRNYQVFDRYEAGIALKGDEVKSLRQGRCSIDDSFARIENGEAFIYGMHIAEFNKASWFKSEPKRVRKLLLHKKQIHRLWGLTSRRGYTLIPLEVYFTSRGKVKVELALAKGRRLSEKREKLKEEYLRRETERQIKDFSRKRRGF